MQNPTFAADPVAPPAAPHGDAAWEQVASELKTVQQQALATQQSIRQLQAQQEASAPAKAWQAGVALPAGGWAVGAVLVVGAALLLVWRSRRRSAAPVRHALSDTMASDFYGHSSSMMALQQTVQKEEISQWATGPETETEEVRVSDWGAIALMQPDLAPTFDLEAATNEVSRVRKTLAQRREERALQRERDARLLRDAAERAEEAALVTRLQAVPHRGSWVPDLDLSQDIAAHEPAAPVAVPEPIIEPVTEPITESTPTPTPQPPLPPAPVEILPMNTHTLESEPVAAPSPAPQAEPDNTPVDVYAVKLALAHESEAIELWAEAHALAEEVLASPDGALRTQAQEMLQRLGLQIQAQEQGANPVTVAPAPAQDVPQIPEPSPEPQEDVYAVKLALAQESEAIELWDEARELAEEVLASPDPTLTAQAQALLVEIQQKLDAIAQDSISFDSALDASKPGGR